MLRMLLRHDRGDDLAEEQARFVRRARRQRDVDVQAVGARRSSARPAAPSASSSSRIQRATSRTCANGTPSARIEIERDVVGELAATARARTTGSCEIAASCVV